MSDQKREITRRYSNGEVTIVWKQHLCTHSGNCVRGLPKVFRPKESPWIAIDQADSASLVAQVSKCPSGALSIEHGDTSKKETE
jgi:putative redox protein